MGCFLIPVLIEFKMITECFNPYVKIGINTEFRWGRHSYPS